MRYVVRSLWNRWNVFGILYIRRAMWFILYSNMTTKEKIENSVANFQEMLYNKITEVYASPNNALIGGD